MFLVEKIPLTEFVFIWKLVAQSRVHNKKFRQLFGGESRDVPYRAWKGRDLQPPSSFISRPQQSGTLLKVTDVHSDSPQLRASILSGCILARQPIVVSDRVVSEVLY